MYLTERQGQVLEFIKKFTGENGYPPTRTEISNNFGFSSPNAAECHIKALWRKGYIKVKKNVSRGIVII